MTDAVMISLVSAMASIVTAVITGFVAIKLAEVSRSVDGMKTDLVIATERGAMAEGQIQGRKEAGAEAVLAAVGVAEVAAADKQAAITQAEMNATAAEKQQAAATVQQEAAETQKEAADTRKEGGPDA